MDAVKTILLREIDTINQQEGRDGNPRLNLAFFYHHPYLCLSMIAGYIAVLGVIYFAPYFGFWSALFFTLFVIAMLFMLAVEIKPVYKFEDIGILDFRVCYIDEWYFTKALSQNSIHALLEERSIDERFKREIQRIYAHKGELDFYDVFYLAYKKGQPMGEMEL